MPYMALYAMENSAEATPRNIGTQCENVDLESAGANNTTRKELWLRSSLKKYFRLGVCTSDPLLNAVKWIAYGTEVIIYQCFRWEMSSFTSLPFSRLVRPWLWLFLSFFISLLSSPTNGQSSGLLRDSWSLRSSPGPLAWWLSATSTTCGWNLRDAFFLGCNRYFNEYNMHLLWQMMFHSVVCPRVLALDFDSIHPLRSSCISLLPLYDSEWRHLSALRKEPSARSHLLELDCWQHHLDFHPHSTNCCPRCGCKSSVWSKHSRTTLFSSVIVYQ